MHFRCPRGALSARAVLRSRPCTTSEPPPGTGPRTFRRRPSRISRCKLGTGTAQGVTAIRSLSALPRANVEVEAAHRIYRGYRGSGSQMKRTKATTANTPVITAIIFMRLSGSMPRLAVLRSIQILRQRRACSTGTRAVLVVHRGSIAAGGTLSSRGHNAGLSGYWLPPLCLLPLIFSGPR